MGKNFNSILKSFTNGVEEPTPKRSHGAAITSMTPEQRKVYTDMAHQALRDGLMVYMSKATVNRFERILGTPATKVNMRRLLEQVALGTLVITTPKTGVYAKPVTTKELPVVLSTQQLTADMPLSLKQAARVLNVKAQQLWFRCVTGRIHYQKEKSRYYIPATEVRRLQVIGL